MNELPKRPGAPLEWRHIALVGVLLAGLILICWGCAWFALSLAGTVTS